MHKKENSNKPKKWRHKCFRYAVTVALNYEQVEWNPEGVSNIKSFINKCNFKSINYLSKIDDRWTFVKNNLIIALNILQIKEKEICPVYISKNNSNCQKQTILLMIPSEEKEGWHFLMLKKQSTSLRGITSKHHGDFYCWNCLYSFRTETKIESHEEVCKNKDFCEILMPSEKNNILELNHYMKLDKFHALFMLTLNL